MGRSFKYHRPRGVFTAGSEEPNALMSIYKDGDMTPNVRATVQEVFEGLEAKAQSYVGALELDLMAVNDLLAPFIGAGFYYKTFMWPKSFWEKIYEPLIRRAAGLGALSGQQDSDLRTGRLGRSSGTGVIGSSKCTPYEAHHCDRSF